MAVSTYTLALNSNDFVYDYRDGWNMGVEKNWHVLEPVSLVDESSRLTYYDLNGKELEFNNLGITIFYKIVVPLYFFSDANISTNDMQDINDNYLSLQNATLLGAPQIVGVGNVNQNITLDIPIENAIGAYALPSDDLLNQSSYKKSDFTSGAQIGQMINGMTIGNKTLRTKIYGIGDRAWYFLMSHSTSACYALSSMQITKGVSVAYSVNPTSENMELPTTSLYKASGVLMPQLFRPFGLNTFAYTSYRHSEATYSQESAWMYYVLGVKDMSTT